jgi:hypothetical protein
MILTVRITWTLGTTTFPPAGALAHALTYAKVAVIESTGPSKRQMTVTIARVIAATNIDKNYVEKHKKNIPMIGVFREHVPPLCLGFIGASAQQNNYELR